MGTVPKVLCPLRANTFVERGEPTTEAIMSRDATRTTKQRPVHEVKAGMAKAAIWRNETQSGPRYSVTFQRLYKDGDAWKSTASFNPRDLGDVVECGILAGKWIREQTSDDAPGAST